jgi:hypothetical protein
MYSFAPHIVRLPRSFFVPGYTLFFIVYFSISDFVVTCHSLDKFFFNSALHFIIYGEVGSIGIGFGSLSFLFSLLNMGSGAVFDAYDRF